MLEPVSRQRRDLSLILQRCISVTQKKQNSYGTSQIFTASCQHWRVVVHWLSPGLQVQKSPVRSIACVISAKSSAFGERVVVNSLVQMIPALMKFYKFLTGVPILFQL